jgi:hypothetical protein
VGSFLLDRAWRDPRFLVPIGLGLLFVVLGPMVARRRLRKTLLSGDVHEVLRTWQELGTRAGAEELEELAPLTKATAYAAYGWVDDSRHNLDRTFLGRGEETEEEQRLVVETLLDIFEGRREEALAKATTLETLPLYMYDARNGKRVLGFRRGVAAMARAFAHCSHRNDLKFLAKAATEAPLLHWAMKYAQAVVAVDEGRWKDASQLLQRAPNWPAESAFRTYHDELVGVIGSQARA